MVYSTCISGNKNVRDVLATLSMTSILFESLMSIGCDPCRDSSALIDIVHLFPEIPLFLIRKGCIIEACEDASEEAKNELVFLSSDELKGRGWLKKLSLHCRIKYTLCTLHFYWQHLNCYLCIVEYCLMIHESNKIDGNTGMILILITLFYFGMTLGKSRWSAMKSRILCMLVLIIWCLTFVVRINNLRAILYKITFQSGLKMISKIMIDEIFSPELKDIAVILMTYDDMIYFVENISEF